jgi:hypothetical protein
MKGLCYQLLCPACETFCVHSSCLPIPDIHSSDLSSALLTVNTVIDGSKGERGCLLGRPKGR